MKKKIVLILVLGLLVLLLVILLYLFLTKKNPQTVSPIPTQNEQLILPLSPAPSGEYNVLLLGQGDVGHPGGALTDSMMILHLNTISKKAALIFLPRDLWITQAKMKINEVYSKNSFQGIEQAVSAITNLPIQYAMIVDFNGFAQIIDALGGIEINVSLAFDDYFYPIKGRELEICDKTPEEVASLSASLSGFELEKQFPCRYEHLHFDKGKTQVDGQTALKFARSRHSAQDGSDYGRGARQQVILIGIKDKLLSLEALKNIDKWFNKFIKLVKTDLNLETTRAIAALIIDPQEYQISQIVPSEENVLKSGRGNGGQFILIPKLGENDWNGFQEFIKKGI